MYWHVPGTPVFATAKLLSKMQDFFDKFDNWSSSVSNHTRDFISDDVHLSDCARQWKYNLVKVISDGKLLMALAVLFVAKLFFTRPAASEQEPAASFTTTRSSKTVRGGLYSTFLSTAFGVRNTISKASCHHMAGFFSAIVGPHHGGYISHHRDDWNFMTLLSLVSASLVAYVVALTSEQRTSIQSAYAQETAKEGGGGSEHTRPWLFGCAKSTSKIASESASIKRKVMKSILAFISVQWWMDTRSWNLGFLKVAWLSQSWEMARDNFYGSTILNSGDDLSTVQAQGHYLSRSGPRWEVQRR